MGTSAEKKNKTKMEPSSPVSRCQTRAGPAIRSQVNAVSFSSEEEPAGIVAGATQIPTLIAAAVTPLDYLLQMDLIKQMAKCIPNPPRSVGRENK